MGGILERLILRGVEPRVRTAQGAITGMELRFLPRAPVAAARRAAGKRKSAAPPPPVPRLLRIAPPLLDDNEGLPDAASLDAASHAAFVRALTAFRRVVLAPAVLSSFSGCRDLIAASRASGGFEPASLAPGAEAVDASRDWRAPRHGSAQLFRDLQAGPVVWGVGAAGTFDSGWGIDAAATEFDLGKAYTACLQRIEWAPVWSSWDVLEAVSEPALASLEALAAAVADGGPATGAAPPAVAGAGAPPIDDLGVYLLATPAATLPRPSSRLGQLIRDELQAVSGAVLRRIVSCVDLRLAAFAAGVVLLPISARPSRAVRVGPSWRRAVADVYAAAAAGAIPDWGAKHIVNATIGLLGKKRTARETSFLFGFYEDSMEARAALDPARWAWHVFGDHLKYIVTELRESQLIDGFLPVRHALLCHMDLVLEDFVARLEVAGLSPFAQKTDAVFVLGEAASLALKCGPKLPGAAGIGAWGSRDVHASVAPLCPPRVSAFAPGPAGLPAPAPSPEAAGFSVELDDEWDMAAAAQVLLSAPAAVLVTSPLPGAGKTHLATRAATAAVASAAGRARWGPGGVLVVCSVHAMVGAVQDDGYEACTTYSLLGMRPLAGEAGSAPAPGGDGAGGDGGGAPLPPAGRVDLSLYAAIVFDEVYTYPTRVARGIEELMQRWGGSKLWVATGDGFQGSPIEDLRWATGSDARRSFYERIVGRLFPARLTLRVCKRASPQWHGSIAAVAAILHDASLSARAARDALLALRAPSGAPLLQVLPSLSAAAALIAPGGGGALGLSYLRATARRADAEVQRCLAAASPADYVRDAATGGVWRVGATLRASLYRAPSKAFPALHPNVRWRLAELDAARRMATIERCSGADRGSRYECSLAVLARHFSYGHVQTEASCQGATAGGSGRIFILDFERMRAPSLLVALTRARDWGGIFVVAPSGRAPGGEAAAERGGGGGGGPAPSYAAAATLHGLARYLETRIAGYRQQDADAGRLVSPDEPYVSVASAMERAEEQDYRCWRCGTDLEWESDADPDALLTLDRADNALPHYASTCWVACMPCQRHRDSMYAPLRADERDERWQAVAPEQ